MVVLRRFTEGQAFTNREWLFCRFALKGQVGIEVRVLEEEVLVRVYISPGNVTGVEARKPPRLVLTRQVVTGGRVEQGLPSAVVCESGQDYAVAKAGAGSCGECVGQDAACIYLVSYLLFESNNMLAYHSCGRYEPLS